MPATLPKLPLRYHLRQLHDPKGKECNFRDAFVFGVNTPRDGRGHCAKLGWC